MKEETIVPRVCMFDVNETLLDLAALDPHFERIFGDASVRQAWFGQFLALWLTETVTSAYTEFGTIGGAALEMLAGRQDYFEQVLSADTVKRLKPAPEPYRLAADSFGVQIGQIRLVAAHAWDIAGALRAGCAAAFVARPGMVLNPLVEHPDVVGADLREVADQIIELESAG